MKTEHLARADFLRELRTLSLKLYSFGDFTVDTPARQLYESKLDGFIDAGLLLKVCSRKDMQEVIDQCHFETFGESRSDRRKRLTGVPKLDTDSAMSAEWDKFDAPAFERSKNKRREK